MRFQEVMEFPRNEGVNTKFKLKKIGDQKFYSRLVIIKWTTMVECVRLSRSAFLVGRRINHFHVAFISKDTGRGYSLLDIQWLCSNSFSIALARRSKAFDQLFSSGI